MTTLKKVHDEHISLCKKAFDIVEQKGHDYNRTQQNNGDTLFNLVAPTHDGITDTMTQPILVRISDKWHRLISLANDPNVNPQISGEKVEDTIVDMINYLIYLKVKYDEERIKTDNI
jgi:hypothetical protein